MKVVIVGAGAVGCRVGAHFQKGGADVVLYDVWKEHVDAINKNGLKMTEMDGSVEYFKIPATTRIEDAGEADAIVILTKAAQTENALRAALPIVGERTVVMSIQNGLGNFDIIESIVERDRMIIGCTLTATTMTGPGEIRNDNLSHSDIQALGKIAGELIIEIRDTLERGGMEVVISENVLKEIWQKLSFNAAMNPITGITRVVVGRTGKIGEELASWISEEVARVAEAEGVPVNRDFALRFFRRVTGGPEAEMTHLTSMLQDVVKEQRTEVDAICGAVIRRAKKHGIPVPHLETLYSLIRIIESNYEYQLTPEHPDPIV
jgi:2-dehydropantoate 2-reductase